MYNLNINFINQIFKLIIEDSVLIQKKILNNHSIPKNNNVPTFNFLGPKGSYSYIAMHKYAKQHFKKFKENQCSSFKDVIEMTEEKNTHYAILPIENTSSGPINEVYNILNNTNLFMIDEIYLQINHCLLTTLDTSLKNIKIVYSHPQPFQQCSKFINHFPNWNMKYTSSSAEAMKKISKIKKNNIAALGSEIGSQLYNLKILLHNISNQQYNITRFIILNNTLVQSSNLLSYKTTLSFMSTNKSNDLINILLIFKENKLIMQRLIIIPLNKTTQQKMFYIDVLEHLKSFSMKNALVQLRQMNQSLKILGCYQSNNFK